MKNTNDSKHIIHRRDFIKGGAAVSIGLASGALGVLNSCGQTFEKRNAIQLENAKPGTRDWMLTKTDITANEPVELWRSSANRGLLLRYQRERWRKDQGNGEHKSGIGV